MSIANIEAPYTILSVPSPLDSSHGRIQSSPVCGLKTTRKRKRHEVAVGIDGEGVNLYNVQSHNLITSYALPPQSYLCCPPCSVYNGATTTAGARRSIFVVIKDGQQSSKRRLLSFTESVKNKRTGDNEFTSPEKRECKLRDGEVLSLDVVQYSSEDQHSVLVNYRNGGAEFISSDLSKTHWQDRLGPHDEDSYEVEHATVLDVESARKGILKGREDIIALLDQNGTQMKSATLLCRLIRSDQKRCLLLHVLRDPTQSPIQTTRSALKLLTSFELPSPSKRSTNAAQYELDTSSGMLYQLLDSKLNIYDLSGTISRLVTELGGRSAPVHSFARVSASSVLTFSKDTATLFETSFGSVQASTSLSRTSISRPNGKKRKRDDSDEHVSFSAISAFTDLGLVVGLSGNDLIAFQLSDTFREGKQIKSHGTLLSDVIGKGSLNETHNLERHEKKARKWEEWTAKIDALVAEDDIEGLEKLVANDPRLGNQRKLKRIRHAGEPNNLQNGHATAYEELWPLPEAFDPKDIDKRKVLYISSKLFDHSGHEDDNLKVRIESSKLLEWLALTGFLSVSYLEKAFRMATNEAGVFHANLNSCDVMTAIRQIDDDFQLMRELLSLPVHWEAEEVVQALRLVIESFDTPSTEDPPLALPAPPPQPNGDVEMTNGDANSDLEFESKAAENELDFVMNALTTGLEVRSDTLRVIILRLHAFPSNVVAATMRSMMSHSEIIFFIHILRIELADGGWTSQYVDAGEQDFQDGLVNTIGGEEERGGPSDQAIRAIGDLLNCAVDAIGTSGWLVGQSSSALRTDGLIDSLRAEVSAGLEGCYEASTLRTLFTELERCAASAGKSRTKIALHEGRDDDPLDGEKSLLPLGSRVEPPAVPGTNEKSSKKTKMAIGREKSRRVGKYSFDRIRI